MAFLKSIVKEDLGVFVNGVEFIGVQNHRERLSQTVAYRTAYGFAHPIIRTKTAADSNQVTFSFLLLKSGIAKGLNSYRVVSKLEDFEIQTVKGALHETYKDCNWTDIDIDGQQDGVTVTIDCTVPGFIPFS